MEENLLIGITVITVIAVFYLIILEVRVNRYSNRAHMLGLSEVLFHTAVFVGIISFVATIAVIMSTKDKAWLTDIPVIVPYAYLWATFATSCFTFMRRQLYMRSLKTCKKYWTGKYGLFVITAISFLGLSLLTWREIMGMFHYELAYIEYAYIISMCFAVFFLAINVLIALMHLYERTVKKLNEEISRITR